MLRCAFAATLLLLLFTPPLAAEECGWLPTRDVDAALPDFAPWRVMTGGTAGSCTFIGSGGPNIFGANQMIKASPAEATSLVRGMRAEMEKSYTVARIRDLGAEAFSYRSKSGPKAQGPDDDRSIFFVAHEGRIAVTATLNLGATVTPEHVAAATRLVRAALAIDKDPAAIAAATNCPWFATDVLKKLLPGKDLSQQTFGSNSCMAQAGSSVVLVSIIETGNPEQVFQNTGGGCTREPVAELGPGGELLWACQGGNPHAKVRYLSGNRMIEYSLAPGREVTQHERALLIELAKSAPARAN
jgi:hypothetical protein